MTTPSDIVRPEPSYPVRSAEGVVRHSRKRYVRGAYLDPRPRAKGRRRS